jgi:hypothetical protein
MNDLLWHLLCLMVGCAGRELAGMAASVLWGSLAIQKRACMVSVVRHALTGSLQDHATCTASMASHTVRD